MMRWTIIEISGLTPIVVICYAGPRGVVPQMSPPPHDLERLRTTMVDFIVKYLIEDAASCRGLCTGTVFYPAQRPVERAPA